MRPLAKALHYFKAGQKGQASVEVAVFGGIFLFVLGILVNYGLSMSTQQDMDMYAFRRAQVASLQALNKINNEQTTYVVLADKRFPNPQDSLAVGQRAPISGTGSVSWTNQQSNSDVYDLAKPRVFIEFIGKESFGRDSWTVGYVYGKDQSDERTSVAKYFDTKKGGPWKEKDIDNQDPAKRHDWVPAKELRVGDRVDVGDECSGDSERCNLLRKEETIVDCDTGDNSLCDGIITFRDDQNGAIDMTVSDADINYGVNKRQGLLSDNVVETINAGSSVEIAQNSGSVSSTTQTDISETTKRIIRGNEGDIEHNSYYINQETKDDFAQ